MAPSGVYTVNDAPQQKDSSFKSFICALLVFLTLCLIIFLVLMFVRSAGEADAVEQKKETEKLEDYNKNEKLVVEKPDDDETPKEDGPTSERTTKKYVSADFTFASTRDSHETTFGNEIVDEPRAKSSTTQKTSTTTQKTPDSTTKISTTTSKMIFKPSSKITTVTPENITSSTPTTIRTFNETTRAYNTVVGGLKVIQDFPDSTTENIITYAEQNLAIIRNTEINPSVTTEVNNDMFTSEGSYTIDLGITSNLFEEDYIAKVLTDSTVDGDSTTEIPYPTSVEATPNKKLTVEHTFFNLFTTTDTSATKYSSTEENTDSSETTTSGFVKGGRNLPRGNIYLISTDSTESATTSAYLDTTEEDTNFAQSNSFTTESYVTETEQGNVFSSTKRAFAKLAAARAADDTTDETTEEGTTNFAQSNMHSDSFTTESDVTQTEQGNLSSSTKQVLVKLIAAHTADVTTETGIESSTLTTQQKYWKSTSDTSDISESSTTSSLMTTNMYQRTTNPTTAHTPATIKYVATQTNPVSVLQSSSTCNTAMCMRAASKLLYQMNHTADPCEDFFDYACGGQKVDEDFTKKRNLKSLIDYMGKINSNSSKYLLDFKRFYNSCLAYEQNFIIHDRLEFLFDNPNVDATDLFAQLILTQSMPLFNIGLDIDKETHTYVFELTLPGRSSLKTHIDGWSILDQLHRECIDRRRMLPKEIDNNLDNIYVFIKDCQMDRFKKVAESFVQEMIKQFSKSDVYNEKNLGNLLSLINDVQDMLPPQKIEIEKQQITREYMNYEIGKLHKIIPFVDWEVFFTKLTLNGSRTADHDINVYNRDYFLKLFDTLKKFNESSIVNALWLYHKLQLYVNTGIPKEKQNPELYCMDLTKHLMPATTSVLTYNIFRKQVVVDIKTNLLFEQLKNKLNKSLSDSTMDTAYKDAMMEKLKNITLSPIAIGDSKTAIANNLNVQIVQDFQSNVVELLRNYNRIIYSLESVKATPATLLRYFVDPFYDQPKSFYASNSIVYTTLLSSDTLMLPPYISSATIGMHLSRELAKHFDLIGKQFLDGAVSTSDYNDLEKQTKDLLQFYANNTYEFQTNFFTFQTDPYLWVNQMIADNTAFRLAFDHFSEQQNQTNLPWMSSDYSQRKIFFIAAAQEYCRTYTPLDFMEDAYITGNLPPPLRIQNLVSNSKEFSDTFNCQVGSTMTLNDESMITQFPNIPYSNSRDYGGLGGN